MLVNTVMSLCKTTIIPKHIILETFTASYHSIKEKSVFLLPVWMVWLGCVVVMMTLSHTHQGAKQAAEVNDAVVLIDHVIALNLTTTLVHTRRDTRADTIHTHSLSLWRKQSKSSFSFAFKKERATGQKKSREKLTFVQERTVRCRNHPQFC